MVEKMLSSTMPNPSNAGQSSEAHRRLRRSGNSYSLTLPAEWVAEDRWKAGESLRLRRYRSGSIVVDKGQDPGSLSITLGAGDAGPHVFRELLGAFLQGYDDILLEHPKGEHGPGGAVREFTRRTGSMLVVAENPGRVELRDGGSAGIPVLARLERMHSIAVEMHAKVASRWEELPFSRTFHIADRDDEVDRLGWLVRRSLARYGGHGDPYSAREAIPFLLLSRSWERVADLAVRIEKEQESLAGSPPPPSFLSHILHLHEQTIQRLEEAPKVLTGRAVRQANEYVDGLSAVEAERSALVQEAVRLSKSGRLPGACLPSVTVVLESLVRVAEHLADVGEIVLDSPEGTFTRHPHETMKEMSQERRERTMQMPSNERRKVTERSEI